MAQPTPNSNIPIEDRIRSLLLGTTSSPAVSDQEPRTQRSNQRGRRNHYVPLPREQPQHFDQTPSQSHMSYPSNNRSNVATQPQNWRTTNSTNNVPNQQHQSTNQAALAHQNQPFTQASSYGQFSAPYQSHISPAGIPVQSTGNRSYLADSRQWSRPSQYTPLPRPQQQSTNDIAAQCTFLERVATHELPHTMMSPDELAAKDAFRLQLEEICRQAIHIVFPELANIQLASFGSLSSGFGMPGSDMDLALVSSSPLSSDLPRMLEKAILDRHYGARLLTRTRVPIIKVCEQPLPELRAALFEEREKWDAMTLDERVQYDSPNRKDDQPADEKKQGVDGNVTNGADSEHGKNNSKEKSADKNNLQQAVTTIGAVTTGTLHHTIEHAASNTTELAGVAADSTTQAPQQRRQQRTWHREKILGPLDFPKTGVGIQCDINFSNPLGLHNTKLLRCYSLCDARVRPMVLFVKSWASRRKINSSYSGTLSSYGYVLMVLHYLVNIASPPVCPNLQIVRRPQNLGPHAHSDPNLYCEGYDVYFWRSEAEIQSLAAKSMLTPNRDSLGALLRQFFLYYAQQGYQSPSGGFAWTHEVLSLRTPRGVLTKEQKGWTGAKTTMHDNKEVRHRYLFAIEDPFELDHNVARTVTHNGIVAIRDEFRRAWRIIQAVGRGQRPEGELLDVLVPEPVDVPTKPVGTSVA